MMATYFASYWLTCYVFKHGRICENFLQGFHLKGLRRMNLRDSQFTVDLQLLEDFMSSCPAFSQFLWPTPHKWVSRDFINMLLCGRLQRFTNQKLMSPILKYPSILKLRNPRQRLSLSLLFKSLGSHQRSDQRLTEYIQKTSQSFWSFLVCKNRFQFSFNFQESEFFCCS